MMGGKYFLSDERLSHTITRKLLDITELACATTTDGDFGFCARKSESTRTMHDYLKIELIIVEKETDYVSNIRFPPFNPSSAEPVSYISKLTKFVIYRNINFIDIKFIKWKFCRTHRDAVPFSHSLAQVQSLFPPRHRRLLEHEIISPSHTPSPFFRIFQSIIIPPTTVSFFFVCCSVNTDSALIFLRTKPVVKFGNFLWQISSMYRVALDRQISMLFTLKPHEAIQRIFAKCFLRANTRGGPGERTRWCVWTLHYHADQNVDRCSRVTSNTWNLSLNVQHEKLRSCWHEHEMCLQQLYVLCVLSTWKYLDNIVLCNISEMEKS